MVLSRGPSGSNTWELSQIPKKGPMQYMTQLRFFQKKDAVKITKCNLSCIGVIVQSFFVLFYECNHIATKSNCGLTSIAHYLFTIVCRIYTSTYKLFISLLVHANAD